MWLFVALAVAVVAVNHKALLDRSRTSTAVLDPPEAQATHRADQHGPRTSSRRSQPDRHMSNVHDRGDRVTRHRTTLALVAGFLAANAWYGALGLVAGWLAIGEKLTARRSLPTRRVLAVDAGGGILSAVARCRKAPDLSSRPQELGAVWVESHPVGAERP